MERVPTARWARAKFLVVISDKVNPPDVKAVNKAAICNLLKAYPNAKAKGFTGETRDFLLSVFKHPFEDEAILPEARRKELIDLFEEQFPPRIIPDLFEIDGDKNIFGCLRSKTLILSPTKSWKFLLSGGQHWMVTA